jgi:hypothetical protein
MLAFAVLAALAGCSKHDGNAPANGAAATPAPAAATPTEMPEGHPTAKPAAEVDLSGIVKPESGLTVADLFARKDELAGKSVVVRGKVVKVAAAIMDRDWVHVRDGSGEEGKNDLTVTTTSTPRAKVGDTVLVTGVVSTNKDLGMGYKYEVMIENGEVKVESSN